MLLSHAADRVAELTCALPPCHLDDAKDISESLLPSSSLVSIARNLVDAVWTDRPPRPENPATVHPPEYAGRSVEDKLRDVRAALSAHKVKHLKGTIVNMLDEVAWLFNLRGTDIPYNPVFFAYGIVTEDQATLFVDSDKLNDAVYKHLGKAVSVRPYEDILPACRELGQSLQSGHKVG